MWCLIKGGYFCGRVLFVAKTSAQCVLTLAWFRSEV